MIDFFDSREDAAVIWAVAILLLVVVKDERDILASFWNVVRAARAPKLLILFGSTAAYCAAVVLIAASIGLWHRSALKETIYAIALCLVLAGRAVQERPGNPRYLRRLLGSALRVAIIVEFLINLYVFPLVVELILVPVLLTLLFMQQGGHWNDPASPNAARFARKATTWLGAFALAYVTFAAATDLDGLLTSENAERLLVAPALAVSLVPFLYAVSWWSDREQRKLRQRFASPPPLVG